MARNVQATFYLWAAELPDSEHVRMLHARGQEVFAILGGEAVERALVDYEAIAARGRAGEDVPLREFLRTLGAIDRGHTRRDALRERAWLQARTEIFQRTGARIELPQSPEQADRQQSAAEAETLRGLSAQIRAIGDMSDELVAHNVFAGTERGPLVRKEVAGTDSPSTETAHTETANDGGLEVRAPDADGTSAPAAFQYAQGPQDEPPSNKQIKLGVQRMIAARVSREVVLKMRDMAKAGKVTRAKWNAWMHKLLTA